ncbi:FGGY family of carbohydrate kinase [Gymnopilus junonius]|uniref:FGGY family of carbohydrate kinase n=1 Tax=Gymnopilus junonius TaxID=109634 RepID=A0A9P5NLE8_GYMJU|nr:FGGY family of carbohydrate kinase [Gymnopilus junonius]
MSSQSYYVGIDVGTGSVRATLVNKSGHVSAISTRDTKTWRDPTDSRIFEQSTADIWSAIGIVIHAVLKDAGVEPSQVKGLGFDATCSLAVADFEGEPVVVTKGERLGQHGERNVILWADHRAEKEADLINASGSIVLDYVGGTMSLEMEIPKILWLKNNMSPSLFSKCQFFDLPDFLTYRATHDTSRSCCSLTCKCSYVPNSGWQKDFFKRIGLQELSERDYTQIGVMEGEEVLIAGMPVGEGLSKKAAEELGLLPGTPVGSALIDAYAGWMGTVAARYKVNGELSDVIPSLEESGHRLAAVAGTSTCHIVQSPKGIFVPGVWGPYKDPIISGWWMNEGGQSSTGQLIDFILTNHPAYPEAVKISKEQGKNVHIFIQELLEQLRAENEVDSLTELTKDLHLYPDFHGLTFDLFCKDDAEEKLYTGNRSPIADPRMRGSVIGLELDNSLTSLCKQYHATLLAIALQTRHIIDTLNGSGHQVTSIFMSGGQARNTLLMQLFADVCCMPVVLPANSDQAVGLGAAMLGRLADAFGGRRMLEGEGGASGDVVEMTPPGMMIKPSCTQKEKKLLDAKYKIFLETIDIQKRWRKEIEEASK